MRNAVFALGRRAASIFGAPRGVGNALAVAPEMRTAYAPHRQIASSRGFATSAVSSVRATGGVATFGFTSRTKGVNLAVSTAAIATSAVATAVATTNTTETKEAIPMDALPFDKVTLYQYDVCPFCNKVKAMLDFHGVPYDVVEVNPLTKGEMKFSKDYKKVPILVVDDEQINNSSEIMRWLEEKVPSAMQLKKKNGTNKSTSKQSEKELFWMKWVDDRFVHVVTPNIYRTWGEAFDSFDYITVRGNFNFFERQAVRLSGAVSMYLISQNVLKKRHGIEDERKELFSDLNKWTTEAVGGNAFCGGSNPNLADLAVFGVLRAVKTFQTFEDAMAECPETKTWYKRMEIEVGRASRSDGIEN